MSYFYRGIKPGYLPRCFLLILILLGVSGVQEALGQITYSEVDGRINSVNTAVPFLRISPDARSSAMGNTGIAISPDANSNFWNLSKIPFSEREMGMSLSYTPWLTEMADDVFLAYLSGYKKLNDSQSVSLAIRYFDLGSISLTDFDGMDEGRRHPREFSIAGGYSRMLSKQWSVGIAFRYIHSNLASGYKQESSTNYESGSSFAGDVSAYYTSGEEAEDHNVWSFGAVVSNIGSKIGYTKNEADRYFIPTNLGIGGAYALNLNENNKLTFALDVNKLLVPTPDTVDRDQDNILDYRQKSVISGILGSFGDAPNGFREEINELTYSMGVEYWYNQLFAIRVGYFNEHKTKGGRKFFSSGVGLKYDFFQVDFSYLIPAAGRGQNDPLSNTLRIGISVNK